MLREWEPAGCGGVRAVLRVTRADWQSRATRRGRGRWLRQSCPPAAPDRRHGQATLRIVAFRRPALPLFKNCTGARQRISLGMNQALDLHRHLHVAAAIKPLAGPALVRLQLRKLRFPKSQNVCLHAAQVCHIPDLEVKAIRDRRWLECALPIELCCHKLGESAAITGKKASL